MRTFGNLFRTSLRLPAATTFMDGVQATPVVSGHGATSPHRDAHALRCTTLALRRSEERLRVTAQVMDQPLAIMDRNGVLVLASTRFAALSACVADDLVGRPFVSLFERSDRDRIRGLVAALPPGQRARCNASLVQADGQVVSVEVALERLFAEDELGPAWWAVVNEVARPSAEPECQPQPQRSETDRVACAMLAAQEAERKRIAADLHDGLGQMLSSVKFGLQSAASEIVAHDPRQARATIDGLVSTVKAALEEVRRLAINLRPSILDDLGLVATLSWFVREFGSIYRDIEVNVELLAAESDVVEAYRLPVFRVVQEAMNNVAKHSRATRVDLRLERDGEHLRLTITDNGVGFDPAAVDARRGAERRCGHCCSRERMEGCGGTFAVEGVPGRGVTVRATWPLPAPAGR